MPLTMKILALDLGAKKTGLAIAQEGFIFGRGIACGWNHLDELAGTIKGVINIDKIDKIIAGVPKSQSGEAADKVKKVIGDLQELIILEIEEVDETLTSKAAQERIGGNGKYDDDEEAAKIILEDYLKK